jgi:cell wall-associated NlpC family hydrolase
MHNLIHLPVIDMRQEPSLASKLDSQALFGEEIQIQEKYQDWFLITTPDGYAGWVKEGSFIKRESLYPEDLQTTRLAAHLYAIPDIEYGPLLTLPYGSKLARLEFEDPRFAKVALPSGQEAFLQKGDMAEEPFELLSFSKKFLGLPYLWGGRSSFGYDCSGFTQMLYVKLGISLARNARDQILDPRLTAVTCNDLKGGDLLFWGKSASDIRHVGMFLEDALFIHASARENKPYLRISSLSDPEWRGEPDSFYPFRTARRGCQQLNKI